MWQKDGRISGNLSFTSRYRSGLTNPSHSAIKEMSVAILLAFSGTVSDSDFHVNNLQSGVIVCHRCCVCRIIRTAMTDPCAACHPASTSTPALFVLVQNAALLTCVSKSWCFVFVVTLVWRPFVELCVGACSHRCYALFIRSCSSRLQISVGLRLIT